MLTIILSAIILNAQSQMHGIGDSYMVSKYVNGKYAVDESYLFVSGKSMTIQKDSTAELRMVANDTEAFEAARTASGDWKIIKLHKPGRDAMNGIHHGRWIRSCLPWHPADSAVNLVNMKHLSPKLIGTEGNNLLIHVSVADGVSAVVCVNPAKSFRIEKYTVENRGHKCTGEKIYSDQDPLQLVREKQDFGHYKMEQVFKMITPDDFTGQFYGSYYGLELGDKVPGSRYLIFIPVIILACLSCFELFKRKAVR